MPAHDPVHGCRYPEKKEGVSLPAVMRIVRNGEGGLAPMSHKKKTTSHA